MLVTTHDRHPADSADAAPSRSEAAASATSLERRARLQARRLGISVPPRLPLPRSQAGLVERAEELDHVVAFLRGRRELAPSIARPPVRAPAAGPAQLRRTYRRAARESLRLGIAPPRPPRPADDPAARAAQAERWRDIGTWLAQSSEARRPSELNASAAAVAMDHRGTPYAWGGSGPGGFDCSGLVAYAFGRVGKSVPHNTNAIWSAFPKVPRSGLRPGDLVFFSGVGHMGIYVGEGRFIHSPHAGDVVKVEPLAARDDYVGAVRA